MFTLVIFVPKLKVVFLFILQVVNPACCNSNFPVGDRGKLNFLFVCFSKRHTQDGNSKTYIMVFMFLK